MRQPLGQHLASYARGTMMKVVPNAAEILASIMEEERWRPEELAVHSGVAASTLAKWLAGRSNVYEQRLVTALINIGRDPQEYGLEPPRHLPPAASSPEEPPTWFTHGQREVLDRLELIADQLARIEQRMPEVAPARSKAKS